MSSRAGCCGPQGRGRRRASTGASAVEFALILPLLLLFLFGIIEYGLIFFVNNGLTEATSDSARSALSDYAAGDTSAQLTQVVLAHLAQAVSDDTSSIIPGGGCGDGVVTNTNPSGTSVSSYTSTTGASSVSSDASVTLPSPTSAYPVICEVTINQPGTGGCNATSGYECLVALAEYGWGTRPVIGLPLIPTPGSLTASSSILLATTES